MAVAVPSWGLLSFLIGTGTLHTRLGAGLVSQLYS